jgi:hypothetical protein
MFPKEICRQGIDVERMRFGSQKGFDHLGGLGDQFRQNCSPRALAGLIVRLRE